MSAATSIDDPDDPRLADYRALNDAALRRSVEGDTVCIAEGAFVVERLLRSPFAVRSFLVSERRWPSLGELGRAVETHEAPTFVVPQRVMNAVAGFDIHRGVLAAATRPRPPALSDVLEKAEVVAVLEGINDHENMGVIFRNADALGVDAVVLDPTCCDPLYRRSIRVSMGATFALPFTRFTDLDDLAGFTLVALSPTGDRSLDDVEADRVAIVLGAEGQGLRATTLAACDVRARIPMREGVDSLG
ncbi:MAG TPA: RNA methyltransferase, partial [Acidimicrobiales bacterium]|nr:RNA methyltransferase [Acidimicrobiales bacterium]